MAEREEAVRSARVPISLAERPLNKGIVRHLPTQMLPAGALLDAKNTRVTTKGIRRRNGVNQYLQSQVQFGPIQDIIPYWTTTGVQRTMVVDQKQMYFVSQSLLTVVQAAYAVGTAAGTGSTVTLSGADSLITLDIRAGDFFYVNPGEATEERHEVNEVTGASTFTVTEDFAETFTGQSYKIQRTFGAGLPFFVDHTNTGQGLYLADGTRRLWYYDGDDLLTQEQDTDYVPGCVTYFKDRVFIARTNESGVTNRQRIRWSGIGFGQHLDFTAQNFVDLPYTGGPIQRLVPFGNMLVAYFSDAIFIGRPTNNPNLPVQFEQIETGGVGLVSMHGVAPWLDGHYFIGQNDFYFLSNQGLVRIGVPITDLAFGRHGPLHRAYASADPEQDRIAFAVPIDGEQLNYLFSFDYNAKAWSYSMFEIQSMASLGLVQQTVWSDLTDAGILEADNWSDGFVNYPTWSSLGTDDMPDKHLYYGRADAVYVQLDESIGDNVDAIDVEITTKDEDYQSPDHNKLWTKFTIKLDAPTKVEFYFDVEVSLNRGRTWKDLGRLVILEGYDEGKVDFLATGQMTRFRLRSKALIEPYVITEFVRRASGQGLEVPSRGPAAGD